MSTTIEDVDFSQDIIPPGGCVRFIFKRVDFQGEFSYVNFSYSEFHDCTYSTGRFTRCNFTTCLNTPPEGLRTKCKIGDGPMTREEYDRWLEEQQKE